MDEFINVLIDEKNKYVNDSFKNVFDLIKQPNVEEIIKIYKDQEPIDEYNKYTLYIKEFIKNIQAKRNVIFGKKTTINFYWVFYIYDYIFVV